MSFEGSLGLEREDPRAAQERGHAAAQRLQRLRRSSRASTEAGRPLPPPSPLPRLGQTEPRLLGWRARLQRDVHRDERLVFIDTDLDGVGTCQARLKDDWYRHVDGKQPVALVASRRGRCEVARCAGQFLVLSVERPTCDRVRLVLAELVARGDEAHSEKYLNGVRERRDPRVIDPTANDRGEVVVDLDVPAGDRPVDAQLGRALLDAAGGGSGLLLSAKDLDVLLVGLGIGTYVQHDAVDEVEDDGLGGDDGSPGVRCALYRPPPIRS